MTTGMIVGIVAAVAIVIFFLWWFSKRSKAMADKPKPKDPHT